MRWKILISVFFNGKVEVFVRDFLIDVSDESLTGNESLINGIMTCDASKHRGFATSVGSDKSDLARFRDCMMEV
jgi:hypothetical protein